MIDAKFYQLNYDHIKCYIYQKNISNDRCKILSINYDHIKCYIYQKIKINDR